MNLPKISVGDTVSYPGDVCNKAAVATITRVRTDRFGTDFDAVEVGGESREFLGMSDTEFGEGPRDWKIVSKASGYGYIATIADDLIYGIGDTEAKAIADALSCADADTLPEVFMTYRASASLIAAVRDRGGHVRWDFVNGVAELRA
jgi:hypothetical protein